MLIAKEYNDALLFHPIQAAGPIPTICDPDGVYPYVSFTETFERPSFKYFKMVSIENELLKVIICPDLGGKVFSIFLKKENKEVLYDSGSVKPARMLPRMAFISGGIEVSFPISHSPVQIEPLHYKVQRIKNRLYVWCGEKEIRNGMNWTIEFSLGAEDDFLTQRTLLFNTTNRECSWMSWSNAALLAKEDSQLYFPEGEVLIHEKELKVSEWDNEKVTLLKDFSTMTGVFWNSSNYHAFGVFTPSTKTGLYHIANKYEVPGIKLWTYGVGDDERWAHQTSLSKESYVEIQAGPLKDQSITHNLSPGEKKVYNEYWIPSSSPKNIKNMLIPNVTLIPVDEIPLFSWVEERKSIETWVKLLEAFRSNNPKAIPLPPDPLENIWPPTGMEGLDSALSWASLAADSISKNTWKYHLGVLRSANENYDEALKILNESSIDMAYVVCARILFTIKKDPKKALEAIKQISSQAVALHPQIVEERDIILSSFGISALEERGEWLEKISALNDDRMIERQIVYYIDNNELSKAKQLFDETNFSLVHQRYFRTELWRKLQNMLGNDMQNELPHNLGEDELAPFGKYRIYNE